ncbi:MAG: hypothetical protein ACE5HG_03565 [Candidatus Bathyarchaeia archaeon]
MSETLKIPLDNLKEWLEQETSSLIEPLKAEGTDRLNNNRDKLNNLQEACEKLFDDSENEMLKSNPKTYRRAREAYRLTRNILDTIDKTTIPDEVSQQSLQLLCEDFKKMLSTVGRERAKRYPRISPYFIMDRRRIDIALKKTADSFEELRSFLSNEYATVKTVEDAFSKINKLLQSIDELSGVEEHKKKIELKREALEKKITESKHEIALIEEKDEAGELDQINQKIKELEDKVKHNLRHLQKPFLKFQTLARSPSYSLPSDETEKLNEYLIKPFMAFVTEDEGYPVLKRILQKMEDAIAKGKMKLKTSRLRKAQKQMNDILRNDVLISLHRSCKEAFSQKQQLLTSEAVTTLQNRLAHFQNILRELQKQEKLMDSRNAILKSEHEKIVEKIKNQKRELENIILELTSKNVRVTW